MKRKLRGLRRGAEGLDFNLYQVTALIAKLSKVHLSVVDMRRELWAEVFLRREEVDSPMIAARAIRKDLSITSDPLGCTCWQIEMVPSLSRNRLGDPGLAGRA